MADILSEPCKRLRIHINGENVYFTKSETSIMAHFPAEGGYENKDTKALLNFSCRLMSKLRDGVKMSWDEIADRAVRSGVGHKCITDEIARVIRECE